MRVVVKGVMMVLRVVVDRMLIGMVVRWRGC